jgi:hypothetical protein
MQELPDIFGVEVDGNFDIEHFFAGVGQVIRASHDLPIAQALQAHRALAMPVIMDEIEAAVAQPMPRTQQQQEVYEMIDRLQVLKSLRDGRIGGGLKEIEIRQAEDGSLLYARY